MNAPTIRFFLFILICTLAGCASIVTPTGGKKDVTPPKLLSVTPKDSLKNVTKIGKIEMRFDEYITVSDVTKEVQVSPILTVHPTVVGANKKVTVKLVDSLLEPNTTYRISFGNAIKDLHEGNAFKHYTYTFSTGNYFDSLQVKGKVLNAATGLPDTGFVVVLYNASESDSAIVRKKPKYIGLVEADGSFAIKGLPDKPFRIYALKDANENLIYDGGDEMIGFLTDRVIRPGDTAATPILLNVFKEIDTNKKATDTTKTKTSRASSKNAKEGFSYIVSLDTSDIRKRTFDVTDSVAISFNKPLDSVAAGRVTLAYDSGGVQINVPVSVRILDTGKVHTIVHINTAWLDNTVYTLRLLKGFAKDTAGATAMPSRYTFRTKRDEDYGKLQIHLPSKYYGKQFLLMVIADKDTIYQKPVMDTMVFLTKLKPAMYNFRIIKDKNEDGKWTTGDLFAKRQPEEVVPYETTIKLKANWDNTIDFEVKKKETKPKAPPKNMDASQHK